MASNKFDLNLVFIKLYNPKTMAPDTFPMAKSTLKCVGRRGSAPDPTAGSL